MKYFRDFERPNMTGAKLLKVERQKLDPFGGGAFVSISYWRLGNGELVGIVF